MIKCSADMNSLTQDVHYYFLKGHVCVCRAFDSHYTHSVIKHVLF